VTHIAILHARAWKQFFDDYLKRRTDVDGGVYLGTLTAGPAIVYQASSRLEASPCALEIDDGPDVETLNGQGSRKDPYFIQAVAQREVFEEAAVSFVREARARGVCNAPVSSSRNRAAVLHAAGVAWLFDVCLLRLGYAARRPEAAARRKNAGAPKVARPSAPCSTISSGEQR
jgi:beta-phosphoglucomutase-like phosphatase (HAD superfamily)